MNWLVVTQPHTSNPAEVVEVRTFVVRCETQGGAVAAIAQQHSGQMIRGMLPLQPPPRWLKD